MGETVRFSFFRHVSILHLRLLEYLVTLYDIRGVSSLRLLGFVMNCRFLPRGVSLGSGQVCPSGYFKLAN